MEDTPVKACNTNLEKLRNLVKELESNSIISDEYQQILKEIEKTIKDEKKVISRLRKPENKLQHYENICTTILSLLSTTKI